MAVTLETCRYISRQLSHALTTGARAKCSTSLCHLLSPTNEMINYCWLRSHREIKAVIPVTKINRLFIPQTMHDNYQPVKRWGLIIKGRTPFHCVVGYKRWKILLFLLRQLGLMRYLSHLCLCTTFAAIHMQMAVRWL